MTNRTLKVATLLLLIFQLGIGMELPAVQPAVLPPAHADCPMHDTAHVTDGTHGVHVGYGAHAGSANKHAPSGGHDCCHASGCQCHGVHTPAAIALPALVSTASPAVLPLLSSAQLIALHIDEFLRPPIA